MRIVRLAIAAALLGCSAAAHAMTVIIYVDPMTLDHYTKVIQTPGPDRAVMCMAPPAVADCHEIRFKRG
jgi:hypothetical protein